MEFIFIIVALALLPLLRAKAIDTPSRALVVTTEDNDRYQARARWDWNV